MITQLLQAGQSDDAFLGQANVPVTLRGDCPACGHDLALRESKADRRLYIGCSAFPQCRFTAPYDVELQKLRDQLARARAEVQFLQLQRSTAQRPPAPESGGHRQQQHSAHSVRKDHTHAVYP